MSPVPLVAPCVATFGDYPASWAEYPDYESALRVLALPDQEKTPYHAEFVCILLGNIGIGKSTTVEGIDASITPESRPQVQVVQENVKKMEETDALTGIHDGTVCPLVFQQLATSLTVGSFLQASSLPGVRVVVAERDLWSNFEIFARVRSPPLSALPSFLSLVVLYLF